MVRKNATHLILILTADFWRLIFDSSPGILDIETKDMYILLLLYFAFILNMCGSGAIKSIHCIILVLCLILLDTFPTSDR